MSELLPHHELEHAGPALLRPTARPGGGSSGAHVTGPAHGPAVLTPGLAVTDATRARGILRLTENRSTLTSLQADSGYVTPAPEGGPCLPPFAIPGKDQAMGPGARGARDVKGVRPPVKRRRSLFRRWGAGQ